MALTTVLTHGLAFSVSAQEALFKRQNSTDQGIYYGDDNDVSLPCDPNNPDCQEAVMLYLSEVCQPYANTTSGQFDFSAPCNQAQVIALICSHGARAFDALMNLEVTDTENLDLRLTLCQSQYFVATQGCAECYVKHRGDEDNQQILATRSMSIFSTSYCAVTNTPTLEFEEVLYKFDLDLFYYSAPVTSMATSTFSDPFGSATAVSMYFTPSITGSAAWVVAQATETASNSTSAASDSPSTSSKSSTSALVHTSNGQIVAMTISSSKAAASSAAGASQEIAVAGFIALL